MDRIFSPAPFVTDSEGCRWRCMEFARVDVVPGAPVRYVAKLTRLRRRGDSEVGLHDEVSFTDGNGLVANGVVEADEYDGGWQIINAVLREILSAQAQGFPARGVPTGHVPPFDTVV